MKVILLEDVKKVGKKGEIVDVSDGYGQNFLIKTKKGVFASDHSKKELEREQAREEARIEEQKELAITEKDQIEKETLTYMVKAGVGGRVFNSVSSKQIAHSLKELGYTVERRKFVDFSPISTLGFTNVSVELFKGVIATFKVQLKEAK